MGSDKLPTSTGARRNFWTINSMSSDQSPVWWLFLRGWNTTQLYRDYNESVESNGHKRFCCRCSSDQLRPKMPVTSLPWLTRPLKKILYIHPKKQTWNLKTPAWKRRNIYKPPIFGLQYSFFFGCRNSCVQITNFSTQQHIQLNTWATKIIQTQKLSMKSWLVN